MRQFLYTKVLCFFFCDTSESSLSFPVTPKKRQGSIESAFADKIDQEKALNLFYNFFIGDIVPAHLTDSKKCLAGPFQQVQHASPLLCSCGEALQLRVGHPEGEEVVSDCGQFWETGFPEREYAPFYVNFQNCLKVVWMDRFLWGHLSQYVFLMFLCTYNFFISVQSFQQLIPNTFISPFRFQNQQGYRT